MSMLINNAAGAYGQTGIENNARTVYPRLASGAISAKDVVVFDALTGTDELLSVHSADVSADDAALIAGVALHDAAEDEVVQVVELGPAIVSVGDATIAVGDVAHFHGTTDGAADGTDADATIVAGDNFGVFLSANDVPDTDEAIVYVTKV